MDLDELAEAARTNPDAAQRLFSALHRHLLAFVRSRFPQNPHDHEDIVQTALTVVHRKFDTYERTGPGSVLRWARVIAGLEARSRLTIGRRRRGLLARRGHSLAPGTGLSVLLFRGRMRAVLRSELERLPSYPRRALEHELDGGELDEFAAAEGVSLAAARAVRARARKLVAARVRRRVSRGVAATGSTPASS